MCGFGGIIHWKKKATLERLASAASKVAFRGPDNTGLRLYNAAFEPQVQQGEIGLFFNRLAILDLDKRSNQPFENERYVIVFNGEIYNYKDIRAELEQKGVRFETSSDTEVLFQALINFGTAAIPMLNGMFAFAFLDKKEKTVLLARDRAGIKPLNFFLDDGFFAFASETDSIIRLAEKKPPLSKKAIYSYLSMQYVPTPLTIWENVYKLPPGCYLEEKLDNLPAKKTLTPVTYLDAYQQVKTPTGIKADLEQLFCNSLESQLQSDVPLGLFLSSGIDSSLVAALINKHFSKDRKFNFYTVAFDDDVKYRDDEASDAIAFLDGFKNKNFSHHILRVNPSIIREVVSSMYQFLDEPFGDYAVMMNYVVSKKAREHVTVVLSGDGSDELFWGYTRYTHWQQRREKMAWMRYLKPVNHLLQFMPETRLKGKLRRKLATDPLRQYMNLVSSGHFSYENFLSDDSLWWSKDFGDFKARKDLPSLVDVKTYLPDCMFYKVDRSSMGASLEVRVPFLDNHIVDYALQLQLDEKSTTEFPTKSPLKALLQQLAPHYRFDIPKRGFSFPLEEWISNEWKEMVYSDKVKQLLQSIDLLEEYEYLLKRHYRQGKNHALEIWRLLNLALWLDAKNEAL